MGLNQKNILFSLNKESKMDPKHLHDTRKKLNDLAISHNRLTTLTACLLNELQSLKREVNELKGIKTVQTSNMPSQPTLNRQTNSRSAPQASQNKFVYDPNNITSLQADEILKQLSINTN